MLIRVIIYMNPESNKIYRFLTNNFEIDSIEVTSILEHRWQIELFFTVSGVDMIRPDSSDPDANFTVVTGENIEDFLL